MQINWTAVVATILPNIGGFASGFVTKKNVKPWYISLKRPDWMLPTWTLGPVWTGLYCSIGYASYLVLRDGGGIYGPARWPLIVYGSNLALNWSWTLVFFGAHRLKLALFEMQLVNITALWTGYLFYKINPLAGYLIIPYVMWLGFATTLNYVVYRDNRSDGKPKIKKFND